MKANMNVHFKVKHLQNKFYSIESAQEERKYYILKKELEAMDKDSYLWVDKLHVDRTYLAKAFDDGQWINIMTTKWSEKFKQGDKRSS